MSAYRVEFADDFTWHGDAENGGDAAVQALEAWHRYKSQVPTFAVYHVDVEEPADDDVSD